MPGRSAWMAQLLQHQKSVGSVSPPVPMAESGSRLVAEARMLSGRITRSVLSTKSFGVLPTWTSRAGRTEIK